MGAARRAAYGSRCGSRRLDALTPEETPYRVRVTMSAKAGTAKTGDAVTVKATSAPAARARSAERLRFRARRLVRPAGRHGLRQWQARTVDRRRLGPSRSPAVGRDRPSAKQHLHPHSRGAARRAGRDRRRAHHRRARRHLRRSQPGDAQFRALPHPLHLRPAHGDHGRHRVLARPRFPCALPRARAHFPHPQMGGGGRLGRGASATSSSPARRCPRCAPG